MSAILRQAWQRTWRWASRRPWPAAFPTAALSSIAALSLGALAVVTIARADGASSTVSPGSSDAATAPANSANISTNSAASANSSGSGAADNGQTLEVPAVTPPSASAPSGDASAPGDSIWSDGTHTYIWKDESASSNEEGDTARSVPDSSLPDPLYASVDDYMNQGLQDEALGPAFSPFMGAPMPFLLDPYYGPYSFYPSPGAPPPVLPPHHHHRHRLGLVDSAPGDAGTAKAPPSFGMGGFGHASRMH